MTEHTGGSSATWGDVYRAQTERIAQLERELADMTAEANAWRANARDSGEEARKYKRELAESRGQRDVAEANLARLQERWAARPLTAADQPSDVIEFPKGAVSVLNPQGTEETGTDRPAAPAFQPEPVAK